MESKIAITFEVTPEHVGPFMAHCASYLATMEESNVVMEVNKARAEMANARRKRLERENKNAKKSWDLVWENEEARKQLEWRNKKLRKRSEDEESVAKRLEEKNEDMLVWEMGGIAKNERDEKKRLERNEKKMQIDRAKRYMSEREIANEIERDKEVESKSTKYERKKRRLEIQMAMEGVEDWE